MHACACFGVVHKPELSLHPQEEGEWCSPADEFLPRAAARHSQKEESSYGEMQKATRSSCNSHQKITHRTQLRTDISLFILSSFWICTYTSILEMHPLAFPKHSTMFLLPQMQYDPPVGHHTGEDVKKYEIEDDATELRSSKIKPQMDEEQDVNWGDALEVRIPHKSLAMKISYAIKLLRPKALVIVQHQGHRAALDFLQLQPHLSSGKAPAAVHTGLLSHNQTPSSRFQMLLKLIVKETASGPHHRHGNSDQSSQVFP
ncbi:hypothetical protein Anapl_07140 [Anas platyrhynchos]|uniref:Uncharacterized protein n=1 Tax=Anas platyrhynchos TaxID=8839 RepID=R0LCP8_ANAPL|nr:hypothetical protein Anapl_07140 [Anas platyrhynchos]